MGFRFLRFTVITVAALLPGCDQVSSIGAKERPSALPLAQQRSFSEQVSAAQAGDAEAALEVALAHSRGDGAAADFTEAARFLEISSLGGNAKAKGLLAGRYRSGLGVERNFAKARALALEASKLGEETGTMVLAEMLLRGEGQPQDLVGAVDMLKRVADAGSVAALDRLGAWYYFGIPLSPNREYGLRLWEEAAARGSTAYLYMIGYSYRFGKGTERQPLAALRWFEKGVAAGSASAARALADEYRNGEFVPKNDRKATELYLQAAIGGDHSAQMEVAKAYLSGLGTKQSYVLAHAWASISSTNPELATTEISVNGRRVDSFEYARQKVSELLSTAEGQLSPTDLEESQRLASSWKKGKAVSPSKVLGAGPRTGTAFFISASGDAITNAHVVSDCSSIRVRGTGVTGRLVSSDPANDLALVKFAQETKSFMRLRNPSSELKQGEEVFVFGFPLTGILSDGGNLTQGLVSAMSGLSNNSSQFQFTAQIQPGSSGSPVLDGKGRVVGVVSSKISDVSLATSTGQVGQSVNFAIRGSVVAGFLYGAGVQYSESTTWWLFDKSAAEIAHWAKKWTVAIECN